MIDRIFFPVDFSPSCASMAPFVQRAATLFRSSVTLLHVCDLMSHNGFELYVRSPQEIAETHLCVAQGELESFLASEFPQAACQGILRSGDDGANPYSMLDQPNLRFGKNSYFASRAAATVGANLSLIHVMDAHDAIQTAENSARRRMEKLFQKVGWEGELKIAVGSRKQALLEAERTCDADLIVIGRTLASGPLDQIQGLS